MRLPVVKILKVLLLAIIVYYAAFGIMRLFGVGSPIRSASVNLTTEGRGLVNVSLEGEAPQRAEDDLKLYPGDRIMTLSNAYATLNLFDGSRVRLDEETDVEIHKSTLGEERSMIVIEIAEGSLWVATPVRKVFSGAIVRRITTPRLSFDLPSRTEAIITPNAITVFSADGLGIEVTIAGVPEKLIVGEGQQFNLPKGIDLKKDLYAHRSPLDPRQLGSQFLEDSRASYAGTVALAVAPPAPPPKIPSEILSVTRPKDEAVIYVPTLEITGRVSSAVARIRVNGYQALIDRKKGVFSLELNLPEEDTVSILIEAVDDEGNVLQDLRRTVSRDRDPPSPAIITSPAGSGSVYRIAGARVELRGTAPSDAVGIIVNGYRLRLFREGNTEWSYIADLAFDNLFPGENVFEVRSINAGGYESSPAIITILQGDGPEGIVEVETVETVAEQPPPPPLELPTNVPLKPGGLKVTAPTPGTSHIGTDLEFLIEGTVPRGTQTLWVNNYRLRLFEPEKGFWNYIASYELGTLRRGKNSYDIVARDANGQILDQLTYTAEFRPGRRR